LEVFALKIVLAMELLTILNQCHHHRGFVYQHARFGADKKSIEVDVRARVGSAAVCSGCHRPAPGYDHLPERRFEIIPLWGFLVSWKETAELFHTSWDKVCDAVESVVTRGWVHRTLASIRAIGVDEIQYAKGHKYLTLVYRPGVHPLALGRQGTHSRIVSGFLHRHRRTTRLPN
jgi:hypothetical protein